MSLRLRLAAFFLAASVASLFLINLCDLLFDCGCRSIWNGAAEACNIHRAEGPHCPWCAHRYRGGAVAFLSVMLGCALPSFWPGRLGWATRLVASLVAAALVGALVGMAQGWVFGYWDAS